MILMFQLVKKRGGVWHPVTGGVETSETFLAGAARELKEETQFRFKTEDLIDLNYSFHFVGRWGPAHEKAFGIILKTLRAPKLDPREHTSFEWVTFPEAVARVQFESQKKALLKLGRRMGINWLYSFF